MKELLRASALMTAVICIIPVFASGKEEKNARTTAEPQYYISSDKLLVLSEKSGELREMTAEEYTVYALLAEIPELLSPEAMKAQAVAARTYAYARIAAGTDKETGAHITDDPEKYQICLTEKQAEQMYSDAYEDALTAAWQAADETKGELLTYGGMPIVAAFHTSSAGMTESAENVWGTAVPYLVPVSSEGEEYSPYYGVRHEYTAAEISARLFCREKDYRERPLGDISCEKTPSGTVQTVNICGASLSGAEFAAIFSLPSAAFDITKTDRGAEVTTYGCGHLAGMSMYGAEYMAERGAEHGEILAHYYPDTQLVKAKTEE